MSMTWLTGDDLNADTMNDRVPLWIIKSVNETVTSSVVLQNDDELKIVLPANETWYLTFNIIFDGTINATGIQTDWTIPADASLLGLRAVSGPSAASTNRIDTNVKRSVHAHNTVVTYGIDDGAALWAWTKEEAIVQMGAQGTIQFRWTQAVSHADGNNVRSGSYLKAERIL